MIKFLTIYLLTLSILLISGCGSSSNSQSDEARSQLAGWKTIFDGESLAGWEQKNGTATYQVVDGAIVGTTSEGSPNSFLCSKQHYGDFELLFEVKVDKGLNSGVQIRSKTREESIGTSNNESKGRVIGPQVEIVEGEDGTSLSGYIWREATGDGWMGDEQSAHDFFKGGQWNSYRIVAKGARITTWINGNEVEDVEDPDTHTKFSKGFIGLQVHGIREGSGPFQVAWKNLKIREL